MYSGTREGIFAVQREICRKVQLHDTPKSNDTGNSLSLKKNKREEE